MIDESDVQNLKGSHCSVPWPLKKYFKKHYNGLCKTHDDRYAYIMKKKSFKERLSLRLEADMHLFDWMLAVNDTWHGKIVAGATLALLVPFGGIYTRLKRTFKND